MNKLKLTTYKKSLVYLLKAVVCGALLGSIMNFFFPVGENPVFFGLVIGAMIGAAVTFITSPSKKRS